MALIGHAVSEYTRKRVSETRKSLKGKCSNKTKEKLKFILKNRCSGENNIAAKTFKLISPNGKEFEVTGGLKRFCESENLNLNVIRFYTDKGVIPSSNRIKNTTRDNTTG